MDIIIDNHNNNIDYLQLQKMKFVFNALDDGWKIEKNEDNYIFSKKHEGKKDVYSDEYLTNFLQKNFMQ